MINRHSVGQWLSDQATQTIDEGIAARDRAPRRTRWMGGAFILTLVAVLLIASAIAEFTR